MVTYGDYFSKKVLSHCGVSPEKTLFEQTAFATAGTGGFGVNLADALSVMGALEKRTYRIVAAESAFATPLAGETVWQAAGVDEASLFDAAKELVFGGK